MNNEAEYEALLAGLRIAKGIRVRRVQAHVDSLLVANQVGGTYDARDVKMKEYLKVTQELMKEFEEAEVIHIPRGSNKKADALSKLAAVAFDHLAKEVKVETLQQLSMTEATVAHVGTQGSSWMTPLLEYLQEGKVPKDKEEERKLRVKALQYEVIEGGLYRKSYLGPSLKCIGSEEAEYVMREIHEGICGMHMGAKMIVARAMRAGYYWPAMFFSAVKEIQKCDHCQIHTPVGRKPKSNLVPDHAQNKQWGNTFQLDVWNGGYDTCRDWGTNSTGFTGEKGNEEDLCLNLNLAEEIREEAARREVGYKKKMEKYHNARVREVRFKKGDLVLRENEASRKEDQGKLGRKWEGPYQVIWAGDKGDYKLADGEGKEIPRTWNSMQLRKYYA
ncbi:uncharacterized protein LOC143628258 [Bidens hawaiensis]|uniref:uncharacterized protein LOC143628258 n=1 Tax=Bidens hawaiensis TaxID=980011 RepID=UPI00404AC701